MRFSPDDVVFRIQLNLRQVRAADEALRAWLPLVSELQPVAVEFEAAHPDGLRRGFLANVLLSSPLIALNNGTVRDRLFSTMFPLAERLGLDPTAFVFDDDGNGGVLRPAGEPIVSCDAPHGTQLLVAKIGVDPLAPGGEEADYTGPSEDL